MFDMPESEVLLQGLSEERLAQAQEAMQNLKDYFCTYVTISNSVHNGSYKDKTGDDVHS